MSEIIEKLKQKLLKKSEEQSEKFIYAIDWLKSTENLKNYDELILSLVDYCSYVDMQKSKVQAYFAQKNGEALPKPALYSNFIIEKNEKETVAKMDSEKYAAYTYSKHYNSAMSKIKQKSECFDSKK